MQTIMLIMRRKPIAQGFIARFKDDADVNIMHEIDYANAAAAIAVNNASVALVEVGETSGYDVAHCLVLCGQMREKTPECKLMLLCPEQDEKSVAEAVAAKREGRIDDFVFYDASLDYLISKLLSML